MKRWYWPRRSDVGQGWEALVAEGGHGGRECGVCVKGVICTKSVPYDTHSHGLCLDSLFLSVSPPLSLFLCAVPRRKGVKEGQWIFLSHNRNFVMTGARPCHTPGTLVAPLIMQRGLHKILSSFPPSLARSLQVHTFHVCAKYIQNAYIYLGTAVNRYKHT